MTDVIPIRYHYNGTDTDGLSELLTGEQIAWSYIHAISGTDFKTINGSSILGSGNLDIAGGSGSGESFHPFMLMGC